MAEKEMYWWTDKTIQIPKGLLIKGVSGEMLAVYAKMKGFGPEARASIGALASRLGWSVGKTKKHQKALQDSGWIILVREGANKQPRLWQMCNNAGEGVENQGCEKEQGDEKPHPAKTDPEANKEIQANKELLIQANKGISHKKAISIFSTYWKAQKADTYSFTIKQHKDLKLLREQAQPEEEDFEARVIAFMARTDKWILDADHSFGAFVSMWNKLKPQEKQGGLVI